MMKFARILSGLVLAMAFVACGGGEKSEAPARGGGPSVISKATDDIPTGKSKDMYLDRYRFGTATDADGIVVRESDWIPSGSAAAISLYVRNAPAGSELRLVWNDVGARSPVGEEIKPVGDKGFVTFKQANPLPDGSYSAELFHRHPGAMQWRDLGGHNFKVAQKR